jgi:hypothetical protein
MLCACRYKIITKSCEAHEEFVESYWKETLTNLLEATTQCKVGAKKHAHTHTHTHTQTNTHIHTHTYIHTRAHEPTLTLTYTQTHTHTHGL